MAKTNTSHSTSRSAAQDLQKIACQLYSKIINVPWGTSDDAEIKPRQSGQSGTDVIFSPRIKKVIEELNLPSCIECKNVKIWDMQRAIFQARANTPKGGSWMLVMKRRSRTKKDRIAPVVVLDLKVFTKLMEGICRTKPQKP